jgi:hypothetical protein
MVSAIGFGLLHPILVPRFEVVDPAAPRTGTARLRGWLGGSSRWLLAALGGAVIYALVEKLING